MARKPNSAKNQIEVDEVRSAKSNDELERQAVKEKVRKFISTALTRFKTAADHESELRRDALDDWKFSLGEQWPTDVKSQRVADGRPCLTMDHLAQSVRFVTNNQREQRPAIQVNPVGDGATRKVADVEQGIVRHIELRSEAEVSYDTAFEHMVRGGFGWLRVLEEYVPGKTFERELRISHVRNPFTVYDDPSAQLPDKSDAKWRFVIEDVPREEYKLLYKNSEAAAFTNFSSVGDNSADWGNAETIRVAEYFYFDEELVTLVMLADGRVVREDEMQKDDVELDRREYIDKKLMWAKINAIEILEGNEDKTGGREIIGPDIIPIVPVLGDDYELNGKRYLYGLTRNAKDPQRMYNYHCSAATEAAALAPKAPWVGPKGAFKSSQYQWARSNQTNFPYLEYDMVVQGGVAGPPPQRNVAEPPIQAMALLMRSAAEDLKASLGIYDASLGQRGPEQSGKAILARQKQGDIATLNYSDNLARSIRCVGRILLKWIPKVYDQPRIQRIINPDASVKHVGIYNSNNYTPEEARALIAGMQGEITEIFDIGVGDYDVSVSVGPNYQSKRQAAVESIMQLVQAYPNIMPICGDLLVGNMDWPYADEIAKRIKKTLPPGISDDKDQSAEGQLANLQQQLTVLTQQHAQATAALQQAQHIIETKTVENSVKLEVEKLHARTQITIAEINAKMQEISERMKWEHDAWVTTHTTAAAEATAATAPPEQTTPAGETGATQ